MKFRQKFLKFYLVTIVFDKDNVFQSLIIPQAGKYFIVYEDWKI